MSSGDFFQHALLRGRGMKGQNFLDGLAHAVIQTKSDSGLRLLLAPLEFESKFGEEQFLEDQANVRGGARRLQSFEALSGFGPVNFPQSLAWRNQRQSLAHGGGNGFGEVGRQIFQGGADDAAKPARGHAPLSGGLVDGHDAADFERGCGFVIGVESAIGASPSISNCGWMICSSPLR